MFACGTLGAVKAQGQGPCSLLRWAVGSTPATEISLDQPRLLQFMPRLSYPKLYPKRWEDCEQEQRDEERPFCSFISLSSIPLAGAQQLPSSNHGRGQHRIWEIHKWCGDGFHRQPLAKHASPASLPLELCFLGLGTWGPDGAEQQHLAGSQDKEQSWSKSLLPRWSCSCIPLQLSHPHRLSLGKKVISLQWLKSTANTWA